MLEVCVDTLSAAVLAVSAGAQRIELSSQLSVGGLTPSTELIGRVRDAIAVPLIVLVRSRAGDFVYDASERDTMFNQAEKIATLGVDGIAIGGLSSAKTLDLDWLGSLTTCIDIREWVMHRAFDEIVDQSTAMEQLISIGFQRILTSGIPGNALDGVTRLQQLNQWSGGRIEILPAGGIRSENALAILQSTNCSQLHGSFRSQATDAPTPPNDTSCDTDTASLDTASIRTTRQIIDAFLQSNQT